MKIQKLLFFLLAGLALSATVQGQKKPVDRPLGKCSPGYIWFDNHNECVPILSHPALIDGVSQEDMMKVLDDHRDELQAIKGVVSAGIDQHGIAVDVLPDYDKLPDTLDGLPVHTHPYVYEVLIGADFPSK